MGNTVFTQIYLFKEKHYNKIWGYQIEREGGASESVWDDDEEEIKPLKDGKNKTKNNSTRSTQMLDLKSLLQASVIFGLPASLAVITSRK